jgi:hypothetical protein
MRLELGCDDNTTTLTFTWTLDNDDVAIWQKTVAADTIDCFACQEHELNPVVNATACGTGSSWVSVNFGRFGSCCQHCPDHYQIEIAGVEENDVSEKCTDADCQQLNGVYLVHFLQSGSSPAVACADGINDWCEYTADLNLRCTDTRYGFCTLHLFIKTTAMCGTKLVVELRADTHDTDNCNAVNIRQGWDTEVSEDCFELDATMGLGEVCLDTNWNCLPDPVTIHVSAPGMLERTALTRLTPIGVPGRRYGA